MLHLGLKALKFTASPLAGSPSRASLAMQARLHRPLWIDRVSFASRLTWRSCNQVVAKLAAKHIQADSRRGRQSSGEPLPAARWQFPLLSNPGRARQGGDPRAEKIKPRSQSPMAIRYAQVHGHSGNLRMSMRSLHTLSRTTLASWPTLRLRAKRMSTSTVISSRMIRSTVLPLTALERPPRVNSHGILKNASMWDAMA